ncbi:MULTISPECIES: hypothetical protein [unclassified Paenibacillus]|uniref:hypothetical protein n=1 Tax=unclassified Paenibacillus TaxID=185978 RepID=UPI000931D8E0|nr:MULTISPECIES: hypothetical protein [unclassified Paenibacillus]
MKEDPVGRMELPPGLPAVAYLPQLDASGFIKKRGPFRQEAEKSYKMRRSGGQRIGFIWKTVQMLPAAVKNERFVWKIV